MTEPLVSIVVPVYNVEATVVDCLNSLYAQSYGNYEVVVVNDGSPDNSAALCREWIDCHDDRRFRMFDKSNGGLADARNYGVLQCSGNAEYVVFVDSDDELTPDALSILIKCATHDSMVIGSMKRCVKGSDSRIDLVPADALAFTNIWRNRDFLKRLQFGIINSSCGNCYSLNVIRSNNIKFKNQLPEDTFFNIDYLSVVSAVTLVKRPIYYYYIWSNSMSTNPKEEIYINYMLLHRVLYDMVEGDDKKYIDLFAYPQYRVNSMNFIKKSNFTIPRKYLKEQFIKNALSSYRPVSLADRLLNFCLKYRLLRLANIFNK